MLPDSWKREIKESIEEATAAERNQRKTEQNEAGASIAAAIHTLRDAQTTQTDREDSNEKKNQAINKATLALVAFTVLFTGLSWWAFREQLEEMQKVYTPIKESADAAKAASEAALKQANAADKQVTAMQSQLEEMKLQRLTTIAQMRAFLRRDLPQVTPIGEGGKLISVGELLKGWIISPRWHNAGNTSARQVRAWFDLKTFEAKQGDKVGPERCPEPSAPDPIPAPSIIVQGGDLTQLAKTLQIEDAAKTKEQRSPPGIRGRRRRRDRSPAYCRLACRRSRRGPCRRARCRRRQSDRA
jgi:hypothetical protein